MKTVQDIITVLLMLVVLILVSALGLFFYREVTKPEKPAESPPATLERRLKLDLMPPLEGNGHRGDRDVRYVCKEVPLAAP